MKIFENTVPSPKLKTSRYGLLLTLFITTSLPVFAGEVVARIVDQKGNPVENAVIMAMPDDKSQLLELEPPKDEIDQIDKDFVPHVKVIMQGTKVFFPNKDQVRHHVYSFSAPKIFELPLYSGTPPEPIEFDTPGQVTLGCNIHDWMLGYIYITDTPYYGKSGKEGEVHLGNLPAGAYSVRIWHPDMKGAEEDYTQHTELTDESSIELHWQLDLKPVFRIPRSSGGSNSFY